MSKLRDAILAAAVAELEARIAWDEPPALYFIYLNDGSPRFSELLLPDEIWEADRPPQVLARMAASAGRHSDFLRPHVPPSLIGVAFRFEGWQVVVERDASEEAIARADLDARRHQIHQRPDRVEVRCIEAVDRAGTVYSAMFRRDGAKDLHTSEKTTGTVPQALDSLLMSLLGVTLPGRPSDDDAWRAFRKGRG